MNMKSQREENKYDKSKLFNYIINYLIIQLIKEII